MERELRRGLRLNVVPVDGPVELILSSGRSPARPPDWKLDYLFVRRSGVEGLVSRFLTVVDGRPGAQPTVREVEVVKRDPLTVRITHSGGVDEVSLTMRDEVDGVFAPRDLAIALTRSGRTWQIGQAYRRGQITACDYDANTVTVSGLSADNLQGRYGRVYTPQRSSLYRVLEVTAGDGHVRLKLDQTPLLFDVMVSGFDAGRLRNGAPQWVWNEREDKEGRLIPWGLWNADAAIVSEDGKTVRTVAATPAGTSVLLAGQPQAERLRQEFTDANGDGRIMAHVYDYGVGAAVEVAGVDPLD